MKQVRKQFHPVSRASHLKRWRSSWHASIFPHVIQLGQVSVTLKAIAVTILPLWVKLLIHNPLSKICRTLLQTRNWHLMPSKFPKTHLLWQERCNFYFEGIQSPPVCLTLFMSFSITVVFFLLSVWRQDGSFWHSNVLAAKPITWRLSVQHHQPPAITHT